MRGFDIVARYAKVFKGETIFNKVASEPKTFGGKDELRAARA